MIELTVKTLDSQNHAFSVPDDTTVKQLKERIAESISFPVESQRLIYCGRVLQDEKNLSEYDVNGKVIHLVQRPPPQATRSNGGQQRSSSNQSGRRGNHHFRQPRLDGNAMYLGAMAFPADLMDAQGIQAPPSSHSLSDSRLLLARRMLRRASVVLNRLENPTVAETSDPDTPPDEQQDAGSNAATGAVAAATAAASTTAGTTNSPSNSGGNLGSNHLSSQNLVEGQQRPLPFAQAAQAAHAATAAAIAAAVSAAHAAGVPNITIVRSGQSGPDVVDVRMEGDDDNTGPEPSSSQRASQETSAQSSAPEGQTQEAIGENAEGAESPSVSPSTNGQSNVSNDEPPRTTVLADLLDELNRVNQRLQPYMQQYHSLMREYPNPENNTTTQESQRVFSSVSEIMHFLSHAYHALSDIMCDFSQPPPRALRCRPVLIQHSAVLQAGIPIQAQINVMTNRNNPNNNNNISTNNNGASALTGTAPGTPQAAAPAVASDPAEPVQQPAPNSAPQDSEASAPSTQEEGRNRETRDNQEPAFNITPGNVEFFMEVGPGSITIDSLEATVVTNSGSMGGDGIQANVVGGSFPWGAPPPPEFIQNLMQAVAGHMIGRGGTAPSNTTTNQGGTGASTGTAISGQNSQARGNTATHPTTATQTRSTSRPHVHLAPATMQGLGSSSFDPFLPCNSHHIRSRARQNAQTFTQQFAAAMGATAAEALGATDQEPTASATTASSAQSNQNTADGQPPVQSSSSQTSPGSGAATSQAQASNSSQQQSSQNSQSQSTPNAQSSSSQNTAQGPQQQAISSLLNTLSNIFGHMPTGGAATVNLSNIFQPMMMQAQAQAQQRSGSQAGSSQPSGGQSASGQSSQSASNQTGAAMGGSTQFPPGMAFFNFSSPPCFSTPPRNQPHNSSSTPRTTRTQQQSQQQSQQQTPQPEPASFFQRAGNQPRETQDAFYNPMLAQLFQGIQNVTGTELFNMGNIEGNLADFLMTEGREYHAGTSLIVDFLVTMGRNMSLVDIMNITFGNFEFLNRIRPQMRQFLLESAFENQPVTIESTARVVERFVQEIRPHLEIMQQAKLREDVDLVTTTIRYNQIRLPELISLIVEGNEINFGQNMVRWFTRYLREISAIVLHCCLDGEQGLNKILRGYVVELTSGVHPALQVWTIDSCVAHMQNYMRRQNVPFDEIREYLVYRVHPHQSDSTAHQSSFNSNTTPNMRTDHSSTPTPEPMDTDPSPDEPSAALVPEAGMQEESSTSEHSSATPAGDVLVGTTSPDMPSPTRMQAATVEAVSAPTAVLGAPPHPEVNVPTREVVPPKREPESPLPSLTMDGEPLPDVVLGSEAWHNVLPSEWVPIIARDSQRQRRQNSQAPFSDAYLTGMPSKRRKVVTSAKPQGNLNQIITESMRSALDEAGVRPVAGVETAGEDLELQAAYREQVRSAVQDSLGNNPDFTPERFPNATKYFSK